MSSDKNAIERLMERVGHLTPDGGVVSVEGLQGLQAAATESVEA